MDSSKQLIVINGKDKTEAVVSLQFSGGKCNVTFNNSSRVYSYNSGNVRIIKLKQKIDPNSIIFKYKGSIITNIEQVRDFGEFYRVVRAGKKELSCKRTDVQISKNCLAEAKSKELFQYFKDTATAVSLKTENGINILKLQYDKITAVDDCTVLSRFLNTSLSVETRSHTAPLIFPFGINQSQKAAVENAFSSQVSIIQGPPGTGKTQTILNIIANAVRNGKSVAVVSNNNSATLNVAEKMEKQGVSFLTAFLGSLKNKNRFLEAQTGTYPNMQSWILDSENKNALDRDVTKLSEELNAMLNSRNRIAEIDQELLALKPEQFYFEKYYEGKRTIRINSKKLSQLIKHKRVSEYDSENIAYAVIEKILYLPEFSKIDCAVHSSVATLIRDYSLMNDEEAQYASNPLTHLDFLLFNKMDKKPIMAIEIDGTRYHAEGSRQAERDLLKNSVMEKYGLPLLRIRTNESGIENRIVEKLRESLQ